MAEPDTTGTANSSSAETSESPSGPTTFILRLYPSEAGRVSGVIERLRTGEKQQVRNLDALGSVIEEMLGRRRAPPM